MSFESCCIEFALPKDPEWKSQRCRGILMFVEFWIFDCSYDTGIPSARGVIASHSQRRRPSRRYGWHRSDALDFPRPRQRQRSGQKTKTAVRRGGVNLVFSGSRTRTCTYIRSQAAGSPPRDLGMNSRPASAARVNPRFINAVAST
jgi:hypothetical protein